MKIALLLHSGVGGSSVVATELGLHLASIGHEVHLIANSVPFRLAETPQGNIYFHQIATMTYPLFDAPLTTLSEASKLVEVIEDFGIDVIHAHYAIPHAAAAIIARQMLRTTSLPGLVTTLHGTDVTLVGLDQAYLRATQWSIEASDVVTAVSSYLAHTTVHDMGVRRDDIHVVYNAVDTSRFQPGGSAELRARFASRGEKILMHTSNFRPVKRIEDVIRVFAAVNARVPARLVMVGEGPDRPRATTLARELGVDDRIAFVGSVPRVETLLAIADVFLLPSAKESFGLSALEAMACGVPVVGSTIGGLPEVVEHGVSGRLHPVGDVSAMTESTLELLTDDALHRSYAHAARTRAETQFTEDKMSSEYLELYDVARERR